MAGCDLNPILALETADEDVSMREPAAVAAQVLETVLAAQTSATFWLQHEIGISNQQVQLPLRQLLKDLRADSREPLGECLVGPLHNCVLGDLGTLRASITLVLPSLSCSTTLQSLPPLVAEKV